jgi:hypothetical protein
VAADGIRRHAELRDEVSHGRLRMSFQIPQNLKASQVGERGGGLK